VTAVITEYVSKTPNDSRSETPTETLNRPEKEEWTVYSFGVAEAKNGEGSQGMEVSVLQEKIISRKKHRRKKLKRGGQKKGTGVNSISRGDFVEQSETNKSRNARVLVEGRGGSWVGT